MRFKKSPHLKIPGAVRTRAWHHHGSHMPTSPGAILPSHQTNPAVGTVNVNGMHIFPYNTVTYILCQCELGLGRWSIMVKI